VKEALRFIDCKNNPSHTVAPRKSLEIPVMVVCIKCAGQKDSILLYYPREDKWSMFQGAIPSRIDMVSSCCGKVHFLSQKDKKIFQYDLYFNCSTSVPLEEHWRFHNLFVRNEGKIYALVKHKDRRSLNHPLHIIKKKPESNSWDCVSSFDATGRVGTCIVCSNNFIYFIGGTAVTNGPERVLAAADRYDTISNTWDKVADIREPRSEAYGAAGQGKIFIAGGHKNGSILLESCEMYHEARNEWQLIASPRMSSFCRTTLCVDGKLYLFTDFSSSENDGVIDCYDPDRNEWEEKT